MWAVNEADLSAQTASGYVHVVMLDYGLEVGLAVADLLPLLPPTVHRLRALLALCPSLCLPLLATSDWSQECFELCIL